MSFCELCSAQIEDSECLCDQCADATTSPPDIFPGESHVQAGSPPSGETEPGAEAIEVLQEAVSGRKPCPPAGSPITYRRRQRGIVARVTSWKPVSAVVSHLRRRQKPDGWHISQFFRQLSALLEAGISLIKSLEITAQQTSNLRISEAIQILNAEIRSGSTFSQAMRSTNGVFTEFHAGAVQGFEVIGDLGHIFLNLSELEEKNYHVQQRLKSVLIYPIIICIVSAIGILCLVKFLLPLVRGVIERSNQAIPWPTQILISVGNVLENPLLLVSAVLMLVGTVLLIRWIFSIPRFRVLWDGFRYQLPYIGAILRSSMVVQVSRSISALISSSIPLTSAIELTAISCGSPYLKEKVFAPAREFLRTGESFSQALGGQKIFPRSFHGMVSIGEQTGRLPEILLNLANIYEMELDVRIEMALKAIEPIVLFMVGLLVLLVMICAFMPLYQSLSGLSAM